MGDNDDTPRPGRYGVVLDQDKTATIRPPPRPSGASVTADNAILVREIRAMRDETARQFASQDKATTKLQATVTKLADHVMSHERELAVITATKKAEEKSSEDTGRFHLDTIQRIHGRIDAVVLETKSLREKLDANREFIWKVAFGTAVGGGVSGGVVSQLLGAVI